MWISIGLAFAAACCSVVPGGAAAGEYLSGYLIEKSLSIDNVFVWAVIFGYFGVPAEYQLRVLFWGIFGALVLRAIFIFAGVALIEPLRLDPLRVRRVPARSRPEGRYGTGREVHPEHNPVLKLVRRVVPVTDELDGQQAVHRKTARARHAAVRRARPRRGTDVIFAVDSMPGHPGGVAGSRSWCSPRTPSPSSACGRCTSCSPAWPTGSVT